MANNKKTYRVTAIDYNGILVYDHTFRNRTYARSRAHEYVKKRNIEIVDVNDERIKGHP